MKKQKTANTRASFWEINFNRHFYRYTPPRPLEEMDKDLKKAEDEILRLLKKVTT